MKAVRRLAFALRVSAVMNFLLALFETESRERCAVGPWYLHNFITLEANNGMNTHTDNC